MLLVLVTMSSNKPLFTSLVCMSNGKIIQERGITLLNEAIKGLKEGD